MADWPYSTAIWQRLRRRKLAFDPLCRACSLRGRVAPANTVDHVLAIAAGGPAFPPLDGLMSLCTRCHNEKTNAVDRPERSLSGRRFKGFDVHGNPIDPGDAWHGEGGRKDQKPADARPAWAMQIDLFPKGMVEKSKPTSMARPAWFRKVHVPLTLVCGPPGSGKSTWVARHAGPRDRVICFDRIAADLFGPRGGRRPAMAPDVRQAATVLRQRNEMLGDLMRAAARPRWPAVWLIVGEAKAEDRQWWQETVRPHRIVVLTASAELCKARVAADSAGGDRRPREVGVLIDRWWADYRPRAGDVVVDQLAREAS